MAACAPGLVSVLALASVHCYLKENGQCQGPMQSKPRCPVGCCQWAVAQHQPSLHLTRWARAREKGGKCSPAPAGSCAHSRLPTRRARGREKKGKFLHLLCVKVWTQNSMCSEGVQIPSHSRLASIILRSLHSISAPPPANLQTSTVPECCDIFSPCTLCKLPPALSRATLVC